MTQTQRKLLEWPILILLIWFSQIIEISFLNHAMPWAGAMQLCPIIIFYIATNRPWGILTLLTVLFSLLGSSTVGFPLSIYMAAYLWTALTIKSVVSGITLEGRNAFFTLSLGAQLLAKVIIWFLLSYQHQTLPIFQSVIIVILNSVLTAGLAWILYPYIRRWDRYFEHNIEDANDLSAGALR